MKTYVDCPLCGEEVTVNVTPGDPGHGPTYSCGGYPGHGPEAEIIEGCECEDSPLVNAVKWQDHIIEAALEAPVWDRYEDDGDARYDAWKDDQIERGLR